MSQVLEILAGTPECLLWHKGPKSLLSRVTVLQFLLCVWPDYVKAGESRWGLDYGIVNKIMCSLEGGYLSGGSEKGDYSGISKVCLRRCTRTIDKAC